MNIKYNHNEEPIVLSKYLLDVLLTDEKPDQVLSLYSFYYYTAKWQGTNTPKASVSYVAGSLHWGENKVRAVKKRLKKLNLIQDKVTKDKNNKITGHYVKLNFIWSSYDKEKATLAESHSVVHRGTNTIRSIINNTTTNKKYVVVSDFEKVFWNNYPSKRKNNKGKCYTLWKNICTRKNENPPTKRQIKVSLRRQKETDQWKKNNGKYIPLASTWLNQMRWLDDPDTMMDHQDNKEKDIYDNRPQYLKDKDNI